MSGFVSMETVLQWLNSTRQSKEPLLIVAFCVDCCSMWCELTLVRCGRNRKSVFLPFLYRFWKMNQSALEKIISDVCVASCWDTRLK